MAYEDEDERLRVRRGAEHVRIQGNGEELGQIVAAPVRVSGEEPASEGEGGQPPEPEPS